MNREEGLNAVAEVSVLDLSELIKDMEEKFGVSAAAAVAVAAPAAGGAGADAAGAEEQTEVDVVLSSFGEKKVGVIKAVRTITCLWLKEAKIWWSRLRPPSKKVSAKMRLRRSKSRSKKQADLLRLSDRWRIDLPLSAGIHRRWKRADRLSDDQSADSGGVASVARRVAYPVACVVDVLF